MERHSENALALATWLQGHPEVSWVNYPGLESHPQYDRAQKYLPRGASGVLTFGLRGGYDAGLRFMNRVELAALVVHVSDTRTSILHPASTTHRQLSPEEQLAAGVGPDMMRVSVGIENIDDIINDFNRALS
jgi:O-acetylhomoserine (thiol)-lyase